MITDILQNFSPIPTLKFMLKFNLKVIKIFYLLSYFSNLSWIRRPTWDQDIVEMDHEIFSTVNFFLPLIQEGQLSVSGKRMCTILVNRLED